MLRPLPELRIENAARPLQAKVAPHLRHADDGDALPAYRVGDVVAIARLDVLDRRRIHGVIMRLRDAVVPRVDAGLGAVNDACLVEDVAHVAAHGVAALVLAFPVCGVAALLAALLLLQMFVGGQGYFVATAQMQAASSRKSEPWFTSAAEIAICFTRA